MTAGFYNGVVQTDLNGLIYANNQNPCTTVFYGGTGFNPTVSGATTAGTTTYTQRECSYTKIGNRVMFSIYISFTVTTGTGDIVISGLPYASGTYPSIHSCVTTNIPWPNNQETYIVANLASSSSSMTIVGYHNTVAPQNLQCPSGSGTYTITINGSYQAVS
jgi:hypothetical protein